MPANELGQPVGFPVPGWKEPPRPPRSAMAGRYCRVEPLDPSRHAEALYRANALDPSQRNFTYLMSSPFASLEAYRQWMETSCLGDDPLFHAIIDGATRQAAGVASFMRIDPRNGVIEVGNINYSPLLQRSRAGTEAMYLMMQRAFGLGYRPVEYALYGRSWASRGADIEERITAVLDAWSSGTVTPAPYSQPHPFLFYGGGSPAAARRAGLP